MVLGTPPSEELTMSIGFATAVGASTGCASISFLGQRNVDAEMGQETKGGLAYKHDAK